MILTSSMRQIAVLLNRFFPLKEDLKYRRRNKHDIHSRMELGEDLEIIMLEMSVEEQEERVRARHEGSQHAVDLMRVGLSLFLFVSLYHCDDLAFRLAAFGSIMNLKEKYALQAIYDLVEPAGENELNTKRIKVAQDMTPQGVVAQILGDKQY